jgi:hypothetical protein
MGSLTDFTVPSPGTVAKSAQFPVVKLFLYKTL